MKKAALHNLGCKVNAYETEAMQQMLEQAGYEIVPFDEKADLYIVNTCTVTNIADRKSRQMLHRAKKQNPEALVVAAGCYVQAAEEELKADGAVDLLIGNNRKKDLLSILEAYEAGVEEDAVIDIGRTKEYESLFVTQTAEHTRAYVKVQDGCNQFCSYCIIPYARGRVRSRRREEVCEEIRKLAQAGYQEVVLTGIHLSSYGLDMEGENLLSLIASVHEIEGIRRIRLGSLEPRIITEEFAKALAGMEKICPHFHLSLQSGCDATLKRMNRRYTAKEYKEACELLRRVFDRPALTTDVIVGFPGETEEEFNQTLSFLREIRLFETHVFKYSRRRGTRAAVMEDQIPERIKTERSQILLELDRENSAAYILEQQGRTVEILVEEKMALDGVEYQVGHTKEYIRAALISDQDLTNQIVSARIVRLLGDRLCLAESRSYSDQN
ncbi:MAG TPA: tRNA (N(6)-L-threonylcarbamoyladenosine(37)-C(2))-methylthiotransferase MtaB [Candidatus Merdisoma merdipullorum]|nr:tRNA (N(6)-L-threonylcarbamoyladenosine(37)-C(2))-methylthiotransferase MtaB [Candidatus Merdisoma merdipullorum]